MYTFQVLNAQTSAPTIMIPFVDLMEKLTAMSVFLVLKIAMMIQNTSL